MANSDNITIEARPESIGIKPAKTAVLVVDMQNDFGSIGGMVDRAGIDISPIRRVIPPTARMLAITRQAGITVIYLKHEHREDLSDAGSEDSPHRLKHLPMSLGETVPIPDGGEGRILIKNTWNTQILDELEPQPQDIIVPKHRFGGFYQTDLDAILGTLGVKSLIVTGCTTSNCVESTVREAMFRDHTCIVLEDCVAETIGPDPALNHEAALRRLQIFGWVSTSSELEKALGQASKNPEGRNS
ncbi:MAG: cysteine hydrolase [Actinomycetota bacterium]|nr:cysteine hydrolase [Actinomycetota bacterium]